MMYTFLLNRCFCFDIFLSDKAYPTVIGVDPPLRLQRVRRTRKRNRERQRNDRVRLLVSYVFV